MAYVALFVFAGVSTSRISFVFSIIPVTLSLIATGASIAKGVASMSNFIVGLVVLCGLFLLGRLLWSLFSRVTLDNYDDGTVPLAHFTFQLKKNDEARDEAGRLTHRLLKRGVMSFTRETQDAYGGGTVFVSVSESDYLKAKQLI